MQHAIVVGGHVWFRDGSSSEPDVGREWLKLRSSRNASICARLRAARVPLRNKLLGVLGWPERRLQLGEGVVIKAKICGNEFLFQDGGPGEKRHGGPLRLIAGNQQHFAFALKKSAGDVTGDVFGESDGAIVEGDVKGGAIQRHFANVVDP